MTSCNGFSKITRFSMSSFREMVISVVLLVPHNVVCTLPDRVPACNMGHIRV